MMPPMIFLFCFLKTWHLFEFLCDTTREKATSTRLGLVVSVVGVGRRAEVTPSISGLALSGRGGLETAGRFQMRRVLMGLAVGAQVSAVSFAASSPAAAAPPHLAARATDSGQTLEVTAMALRSTDPKVCPVDQAAAAGDSRQVDRALHYGPLCSLLVKAPKC